MASVSGALKGKCPNCESGDIFASKGNIFRLKAPQMNELCSVCGYRFDKEPGYFLGAMYISYGLTILEILGLFLTIFWFVPFGVFFGIILGAMILFSFFNFRMARNMWIHIFAT